MIPPSTRSRFGDDPLPPGGGTDLRARLTNGSFRARRSSYNSHVVSHSRDDMRRTSTGKLTTATGTLSSRGIQSP
jgi:hypothetical protein